MHEILLVKTSEGFRKYPDKNPVSLEQDIKHRKYSDLTQHEPERTGVGSEGTKRGQPVECLLLFRFVLKTVGSSGPLTLLEQHPQFIIFPFRSQQQT